jgi:hypothetical protein
LIILTGDVVLNPPLRQTLEAWVQSGGVLVLNAAQTTAADAALLGASVTNVSATATSSYWVDSPDRNAEPVYRYRRVRPVASEVVAMNDAHDPLLLRHRLGAGEVWLATPDYLLSSNRQLLTLGVQLLDRLTERFTPVRVTGFPIQYVVTDTGTGLVTTLINNSDSTWYGEIAVARGASTVTEWIGDQRMSSETSRTDTKVPVIVPPFDVRVIAVEQNRIGSPQRRERTR